MIPGLRVRLLLEVEHIRLFCIQSSFDSIRGILDNASYRLPSMYVISVPDLYIMHCINISDTWIESSVIIGSSAHSFVLYSIIFRFNSGYIR